MSEKRVEYVERENLRGETVRRFEISFGAGTVRVINVESALNLAKWIYELATENGIENEHARLEAQVEALKDYAIRLLLKLEGWQVAEAEDAVDALLTTPGAQREETDGE